MNPQQPPSSSAQERIDALLRASLDTTYGQIARVGFGFIAAFIGLGVVLGLFAGSPGHWQGLAVPTAIAVIFGFGWWLAHRDQLTRGWSFCLGFAAASVPGLHILLLGLSDPRAPAVYLYSPGVWLWLIIVVTAGIMLDRPLARALGVYCGVQNLVLFLLARTSLAKLHGDPLIIDSLTSYEFAIVRSIMIMCIGFMVGQHGVMLRELMRQIFVRLNEEEVRSIRHELARQRAEQTSEAKSALLVSIGHELRTPVNATIAQARALLTNPTLEAPLRDGLRVICEGSEHLRGLIDDVMNVSTAAELNPQRVHIRGLVRDVVALMRLRAQARGLQLGVEFAPKVPQWVVVDSKRLRQVLLNLVDNAIKYTEHGGIEVRVEHDSAAEGSTRVQFCVCDTGVGVAPEQLEAIFLPFVQVGSRDQPKRGAGLGLAISQRLVRRLGSRLDVTSEPGVGSTFWFEVELPLAEGEQATTAKLPSGPHPSLADLLALQALARDGKLKRLAERLRQLGVDDPNLLPFVQAMTGWACAFEDELIVEALDQAIATAGSSL